MSRAVVLLSAVVLGMMCAACKTAPKPYDRGRPLGACSFRVVHESDGYYILVDRDMELNGGNYWAVVDVHVAYAKGGVDALHLEVAPGEDRKPVAPNHEVTSLAMESCSAFAPV
jgi:hypothetical protein